MRRYAALAMTGVMAQLQHPRQRHRGQRQRQKVSQMQEQQMEQGKLSTTGIFIQAMRPRWKMI